MKTQTFLKNASLALLGSATLLACNNTSKTKDKAENNNSEDVTVDRFADIQVLRYQVPGFEMLSLERKLFVYHLSEAALSGRDIIYDQNYKHNLRIRKTLEEIYTKYEGDKTTEAFKQFETYLKRVWFSNGIHHHYSETKMLPEFSKEDLANFMNNTKTAEWPWVTEGQDLNSYISWLTPILFDPNMDGKRVNKDEGVDKIMASAGNFYENVTEAEVLNYYDGKVDINAHEPLSWGLNSKLIKENGVLTEKVWRVGGMYSAAISVMVGHLEKALPYAENEEQSNSLKLLIDYYKTGSLQTWDEFNIAWVKDVKSSVDLIHGFIEVYHDPIGLRANYESCVQIDDAEASARMSTVSANAQWFEDNSPILPEHKKKEVKGVTYKVVNVAMEAGDLSPSTAIGVNLPNAEWIREKHGSKSVSLGNILEAYDKASAGGLTDEFCYTKEEAARAKEHGSISGKMHTALHEVIGHASGQMNKGISKSNMGAYGSTLEEARADLVALYYIYDQKLVDLKLIPSLEVGKAEYEGYIRNGMMLQMRRLKLGENIEEDHMRNRQLVASWVYEKGKAENVIEKKIKDGKTYFVVNDYTKLRVLFGDLLREIQRIKSTGDLPAAKALVETYGVKVDKDIHKEVLDRVGKLNLAAYSGFVQPKINLEMDGDKPKNVSMEFKEVFAEQMLRFSKNYSFLPYSN